MLRAYLMNGEGQRLIGLDQVLETGMVTQGSVTDVDLQPVWREPGRDRAQVLELIQGRFLVTQKGVDDGHVLQVREAVEGITGQGEQIDRLLTSPDRFLPFPETGQGDPQGAAVAGIVGIRSRPPRSVPRGPAPGPPGLSRVGPAW